MRRSAFWAACVTAALSLAACSPGGGTSQGEADASITVGTSPSIVNLGLYEALSPGGAMEQHGLDADVEVVTSGAQAVPLLLNGQLQFSAADPVGAISAIANGVPLEIVAIGPTASPDVAADIAPLLVGESSGLGEDGAAYSGKTIAVNALNAISGLAVKSAIDQSGGKSSEVAFIEMPIPQMSQAVSDGTVDGAVTSEPYVSKGQADGLAKGLPIFARGIPNLPVTVYITSKEYAAQHPDTVSSFAEAMAEANSSLTADPSEARKMLEENTTVPLTPAELDAVVLPVFDPSAPDAGSLNEVSELMATYGMLDEPQSMAAHLHSSS